MCIRNEFVIEIKANIDCYRKAVIFHLEGNEPFKSNETQWNLSFSIISKIKVKKLIGIGCVGYLASVVDTTIEKILESKIY